jgi:putative oxidoreductase
MKQMIFNTNNSVAPLAVRLLLGIVLFPHGAQKLLGWFGGMGFEASMGFFTGTVGLPWIIGFLVIIIEFFGPLALILGAATRLWSLAILVVMAGIIFTTANDYFFMNWFGNQKSEGAEFFLLAIGMSASLIISGAGRFSVDALLSERNDHDLSSNPSLHKKAA